MMMTSDNIPQHGDDDPRLDARHQHSLRLLGHAPCGWRWWGDESEPMPVHRCRKPAGRRVPVVEITVVEATRGESIVSDRMGRYRAQDAPDWRVAERRLRDEWARSRSDPPLTFKMWLAREVVDLRNANEGTTASVWWWGR